VQLKTILMSHDMGKLTEHSFLELIQDNKDILLSDSLSSLISIHFNFNLMNLKRANMHDHGIHNPLHAIPGSRRELATERRGLCVQTMVLT
jgi:hypothetical protein